MTNPEGRSARRGTTVLALLIAGLMTIAACSNSAGEQKSPKNQESKTSSGPAEVQTTPKDGADDVAPRDPIRITVSDGTIDSASLTNPEGEEVDGELSDDQKTWEVT